MSTQSAGKFEVFGDYVLLKQLASGGMAEVFLARPAKPNANGRILVIKRILREIASDPVFIKMFRSEIRVTLGFNHPHAILLHDFGEVDYQPYIAMEYIEGKSLREIMQKFADKGEPIPVPTVLGLVAQAASGLSYAHHFENTATGEVVNAVHRDVSPHNLIVSYDGNLKVIDFGIAKAKNGLTEKTRAGQIKGKCGYLSPEQLSEDSLDGRSDVFSLGIVAWEMLTSQKLFQKSGDSEHQIIKRIEHCEKHIVPPSSVNPEVPTAVDEVILKALAKDVDERYASAAAFQVALRQVMQRTYPDYSYSDTAQIMHALFETDILLERMALRDANDEAQQILAAELDAKTRVVEQSEKEKSFFQSVFKGFRREPKHLPDLVELRVSNLEATLKQKANFKHFVVAAFYVLSIIGIKLDERYSLLDRFFLPAEADIIAMNAHQAIQQRQNDLENRADERTAAIQSEEESGALAPETTDLQSEPSHTENPRPVPAKVAPQRRTAMPSSTKSITPAPTLPVKRSATAPSMVKPRPVAKKQIMPSNRKTVQSKIREPKFQSKPATKSPPRSLASDTITIEKTKRTVPTVKVRR